MERQILIIEDSPFWQAMLQRSLQKIDKKMRIQTLNNAEEFVSENYKAEDFDLIIADHFLGEGQTGLGLWRELRGQNLQTPFLIASGIGESDFLELIKDDLANPHFTEKSLAGDYFKESVLRLLEMTEVPVVSKSFAEDDDKSKHWLAGFVSVVAMGSLAMPSLLTSQPQLPKPTNLRPMASLPAPIAVMKSHPKMQTTLKDAKLESLKVQVAQILKRADAINLEAKRE